MPILVTTKLSTIVTRNLNFFFAMVSVHQQESSRYFEKLQPDFNYVVVRNKFLAELDYTYSLLESNVAYSLKSHPHIFKSLYTAHIRNRDIRLLLNNYLLNEISKAEFLNLPDFVYEFRVAFNHETLEATYDIPFNVEPEKFIFEGLIPSINGQSHKLSNFHPNLKPNVFRNGELLSMLNN